MSTMAIMRIARANTTNAKATSVNAVSDKTNRVLNTMAITAASNTCNPHSAIDMWKLFGKSR